MAAVRLETPRAADQGEFIELVEASTDLHRPWTYPPNDGPGYRGLLERNRSQDFDFRLVRRTHDDAIVARLIPIEKSKGDVDVRTA